MIKKLEVSQNRFYKKIKENLILKHKHSELNIFTYLSNSDKFAFNKLKNILNDKNSIKYIYQYIKNLFSFFYYYQFSIHKGIIKDDNNKLILTWGKQTDFNKKGQFSDRFLGIKSNEKEKTLWVIQLEENFIPEVISKNIIILKKNNIKKLYFFYIFKLLKDTKLNLKVLSNLSFNSLYALIFYDKINPEINYKKIRNIILPYEGQPFQKYFIKKNKKKKY